MSRDSSKLRDWAQTYGHHQLTAPQIAADDQMAATLAALALRITGATGFYRGTGGASIPIITFGAVTLTANDGTVSNFTINIG